MILNPNDRLDLPSASSFEQMLLCPGSYAAQVGRPEIPKDENDVSNVGARVHEALQFLTGEEHLINPRERWLYSACKRGEDALVAMVMPTGEAEPTDTPLRVRETEIRLGISCSFVSSLIVAPIPSEMVLVATGRFDTRYRTKEASLVLDYKTGPLHVTRASENPQMAALCVAEWQDRECDEIYAGIIQPTEAEPNTLVRYTRATILETQEFVLDILEQAADPHAPRHGGPKQCRYCKAKGDCREAVTEMQAAIPSAEIVKVGRSNVVTLPPLTGIEIAQILPKFTFAEGVIKAVRARAKEMLEENPRSIPGWHLHPWTKTEISVPLARAATGLSAETFLETAATVTQSGLRRWFNKFYGLATESKAKQKEFDDLFADALTKVPDSPHLMAGSSDTFTLENE